MRTLRKLVVVCIVLGFEALGAFGQRITGNITGTVTDPSGGAVPGATVTVVNEATNVRRLVSTNEAGNYIVDNLAPASYKVTIEAAGFQTYQTTVTVRVGVATPISAQMQIGTTTATVVVESAAITVDAQQHTVQGVVTADRIDDLPLNGRNFLDLAQQEPGVQVVDGGNFDPTKNQMVGVSVGGRSGRVTRIQVDGVDITDEVVGTTVANISNESIQEFGISQSSLDVSTDITSSGAVNIITRSGSNDLHGSGAFFWRDESFAADSRLIKPDNNKPPFDREIVAARASGPFIQDRLYWAVDYEYNNQDKQQVVTTPQFPQFTGTFGVPLDERMTSGKLDWMLTDRTKGFYRFQHNYNFGVTGFGGTDLASFANQNNTNIHVAGIDYGSARWTHSGRFSYLNFNNAIVDANSSAGTPATLDPGGNPLLVQITSNGINVGPDLLAPQNTFQDNKQGKYDGSYIAGRHTIRFGATYNKIDQVVFAAFFGNAPEIRSANNPTGQEFASLNLFSGGGASDPLNFPVNRFRLGNGLGFFTDKSALGFPFGGQTNHRLGFYAMDTWKVTPNFTLNLGLRYNWNSNLSNHDVPRASAIALFDPTLAGTPRRDNDDFAPQAGFAWNVMGNNKLVIRAGAGIYYETNILNSFLFDVSENIPPGIGLQFISFTAGSPQVLNPDGSGVLFDFSTDCPGVNPLNPAETNCFYATAVPSGNVSGGALGNVIPFVLQAHNLFQSAAAALAANFPAPGVPPAFNVNLDTNNHFIDTRYQTPYGAQMNAGFQYELRSGLVLAVDYVRNRGVHFNQTRDRNRVGAADTLNITAALGAMNRTFAAFGCNTGTVTTDVDCVIAAGGTINSFAARGLGAGDGIPSGTIVEGFAFGGENRNFRNIGIIEPIGLSLYQALQVRLTGKLGSWGWVRNLDTNITYSLSRYEASGVDQDFLSVSAFNDRPTEFFGPAGNDRTSQLGLSFLVDLPWNFHVNTTSAIRSALATSVFLDASGGAGEIFRSDVDGDGVTQDPLPGTNRGAFSRSVKANELNGMIENFNNTVAGQLTPAGLALVQAGLFTEAQLQQLNATMQTIALAPAGQVNNDAFFTTDLRLSNSIRITERVTVEPYFEVFNLFNVSNFQALTSVLDQSAGSINGTVKGQIPARVGAGSGSFSSGIPRALQFGVRVSF